MAECEWSVLEKQALGERVADEATLREGIALWSADRNNRSKGIDQQFKTSDARIKLGRLYPQITMCRTTSSRYTGSTDHFHGTQHRKGPDIQ